jgi:hypothetical protein
LWIAAIQARQRAEASRLSAEEILRSSGQYTSDPEVSKLAKQADQVRARIAARRPILEGQAEAKAAELRQQCEQLATGESELSPHAFGLPLGVLPSQLYRVARQRLDRLLDMVAAKPDAERENTADQKELVKLEAKLADCGRRARERLCDPRNMKWCGDE